MLNYLLSLFLQAEESLQMKDNDNKMLAISMHAISDELSDMNMLLDNHFNKKQNYD